MGCGKGTIARKLSKASGIFAVDTDDLIESLANKTIKEIFEKYGEDYFRQLEKSCALWCEKSLTNTIISTGGGFYKQKNLNKIGTIVYLQTSFQDIIDGFKQSKNYLKKLEKRPLFKDEKEAKKLYDSRVMSYKMVADKIVDIRGKKTKDILKEILR
ncbi:MAG: shikimate kinase [Campylobacteraceae bacterium 4484_166]|nr:MAG: shikimate kinase [Campylobacteraceae bacterium 4484_166]